MTFSIIAPNAVGSLQHFCNSLSLQNVNIKKNSTSPYFQSHFFRINYHNLHNVRPDKKPVLYVMTTGTVYLCTKLKEILTRHIGVMDKKHNFFGPNTASCDQRWPPVKHFSMNCANFFSDGNSFSKDDFVVNLGPSNA